MVVTSRTLEVSWQRVWAKLELSAPVGLFERLLAAYSEPQRHYHTLQHLVECIAHFEASAPLASEPGEVEIALWFHDGIYDVRGKSNEKRSADWAVSVLSASGADATRCQRVANLILATCHDASPTDQDQQLLVDIDLAILGADRQRFAEYDAQVRAEYSWVPGIVYRMKRRGVLRGFLAHPYIYSTGYFRDNFEEQARINLESMLQ